MGVAFFERLRPERLCELPRAVIIAVCVAGAVLPGAIAAIVIPGQTARFVDAAAQIPLAATAEPSSAVSSPQPSLGPGASPAAGLKVIDYSPAPTGFPADPDPGSTTALTEGAHPTQRIPAYDAAGGTPRAYLAPTINGVSVTMPIVQRVQDWVAVLLPSATRTIAWLAPGGWELVALRDQLVASRSKHTLTWYRSGAVQRTWQIALGKSSTPTPLGRTFYLGRSALVGSVYAGIDVMALGAVPENIDALPAGLRGAHIGIHTWYNTSTLGNNVTDGCVHLPQVAQKLLLSELTPGTPVVMLD